MASKKSVLSQAGKKLNAPGLKFAGGVIPRSLAEGSFNTRSGSPFPSPTYDRYKQSWPISNDVLNRAKLYEDVEYMFAHEPLVAQACSLLARGAVGNRGVLIDIREKELPDTAPGTGQEPGATPKASSFNLSQAKRVVAALQPLLSPEILSEWAYQLAKLANLPIQIVLDENQSIVQLQAMPPYGFKVNTNEMGQFTPGQPDAYVQYDTQVWQPVADGNFTEGQIVFATVNRAPWERYGMPIIYNARQHVSMLMEGWADMGEARKACFPRPVFMLHDQFNQPLESRWVELFESRLPNIRAMNGEPVSKWESITLNGAHDAKILEPSMAYFQGMEDLTAHAQRAVLGFGIDLALLIATKETNKTVMEQLIERMYDSQSWFASIIESQIIVPIIERALKLADVDLRQVEIQCVWSQRKSPARLLQEAEAAIRWATVKLANGEPVLTAATARTIACTFLSLDPKAEGALIEAQQTEVQKKMLEMQAQAGYDAPALQGNVLNFNQQAADKRDSKYQARADNGNKQNQKLAPTEKPIGG